MQFRRSGQRDDRRRRVLLEEYESESAKKASPAAPAKGGQNYSSAVHAQLRAIDMVPHRLLILSTLVLCLIGAVVTISYFHAKLPDFAQRVPAADLAALDLTQSASVAGWFSSFALLLAAATSLQIFALRRHKSDDYRGRYRIWVWAAVMLTLASLDSTARLQIAVRGVMVELTGNPIAADGLVWPLILCGLPMAILAALILYEMRRSRSASAMLLLAGTGYGLATVVQLGLVPPNATVGPAVLSAHCVLVSHALVLITVWTYARYVYLEAHDQNAPAVPEKKTKSSSPSPVKKKKPAKAAVAKSSNGTDKEAAASALNQKLDREQLAEVEDELEQDDDRQRTRRKPRREKRSADVLQMDDEQLDDSGSRRLSKRERREIKRQRRQRKAA